MAFSYSPKIVTDGLVLYLDAANPYSYVSGSTVWNDLSRSQLSGSLINGPTYNSANNGSIVFDGVNDCVNTNYTTPELTNSDVYTWGFWLYLNTGNASNQCIFGNRYGGQTVPLSFFKITPAQLEWRPQNSPNNYPSGITTNQWVYITFVKNGSTYTYYINASIITSFTSTLTMPPNPIYLGAGSITGQEAASCRIPMVHTYIKALSAQEVLQNYNATKGRFGLT